MFVLQSPRWCATGDAPGRKTRQSVSLLSLDVEWTKNYRITGGNRPFCYSIVLLQVPLQCHRLDRISLQFSYKAVYAECLEEAVELVTRAEIDLRAAMAKADVVCGHQLTSDLAVLLQASRRSARTVSAIRRLWHRRHEQQDEMNRLRVFD